MKRYWYPLLIIPLLAAGASLFFYIQSDPLEHRSFTNDKDLTDYYTQAQNLGQSPVQQQATEVTFLAVGDISLSRNIAATIKAKNDPLYPFRGIEALLKSTDFNFGNLETPFSKSDAFIAKDTLIFNAPKANVEGLKLYNFAVLNLANNHAFDQGYDGILTTQKVLDENGLLHMGTGKDLDEAWQPAIIEKKGIRIGFIGASYASVNDGGKTINNYVARIEDISNLQSAISNLQTKVDFIVVTMHAGTEYVPEANQSQIDFAHAAIDAGADIVIGAHPHWVQNKEIYKDKPIYYSLGNFIFDQSWSEQTKKGLALKITLSKTASSARYSNSTTGNSDPHQAATLEDLQPSRNPIAGNKALITNIEEIPIYIGENCCPTIMNK